MCAYAHHKKGQEYELLSGGVEMHQPESESSPYSSGFQHPHDFSDGAADIKAVPPILRYPNTRFDARVASVRLDGVDLNRQRPTSASASAQNAGFYEQPPYQASTQRPGGTTKRAWLVRFPPSILVEVRGCGQLGWRACV